MTHITPRATSSTPRSIGELHDEAVALTGLAKAIDRLADDADDDREAADALIAVVRELREKSSRLADDLERMEDAQRRQPAA